MTANTGKLTLEEIFGKTISTQTYGAGRATDRETELRIRAELEAKWAVEAEEDKRRKKRGV